MVQTKSVQELKNVTLRVVPDDWHMPIYIEKGLDCLRPYFTSHESIIYHNNCWPKFEAMSHKKIIILVVEFNFSL